MDKETLKKAAQSKPYKILKRKDIEVAKPKIELPKLAPSTKPKVISKGLLAMSTKDTTKVKISKPKKKEA